MLPPRIDQPARVSKAPKPTGPAAACTVWNRVPNEVKSLTVDIGAPRSFTVRQVDPRSSEPGSYRNGGPPPAIAIWRSRVAGASAALHSFPSQYTQRGGRTSCRSRDGTHATALHRTGCAMSKEHTTARSIATSTSWAGIRPPGRSSGPCSTGLSDDCICCAPTCCTGVIRA